MPGLEEGIPAKYKYNDVRYSHIHIEPGQPAVLTADPWSFLHGVLLQQSKKTIGKNRERFNRANYYAHLAEDFYKGASNVDLPTKGTLLYYGMLNLVKCFLSTRGVDLEVTHEHHGLSLPLGKKYTVQVSSKPKEGISIFAEFAKLLGSPVIGKHELELKEVFNNIPELHGICYDLDFIKRPKYLPVDIEFQLNQKLDYLFTEVVFDKKHEQRLLTSRFLKGARKIYFKKGSPRNGKAVYRSHKRKKVTKDNWPTIYRNILKEYSKLDVCSILTRGGYRYYCDLKPDTYHHLSNSLIAMFYIGTAARYRPSEVEEAMSGELRPLVTETVAVCPKQFTYQLISMSANRLCVIPFADI